MAVLGTGADGVLVLMVIGCSLHSCLCWA
jgi:hypothetical protein